MKTIQLSNYMTKNAILHHSSTNCFVVYVIIHYGTMVMNWGPLFVSKIQNISKDLSLLKL